jgi:hypothetical protein
MTAQPEFPNLPKRPETDKPAPGGQAFFAFIGAAGLIIFVIAGIVGGVWFILERLFG